MAVAQIIERSTAPDGGLYVRAAFWEDAVSQATGDAAHVESFHFVSLRTTKRVPDVDGRGHWKLVGGGTVDPATFTEENPAPPRGEVVMVEQAVDVNARVFAVLRRYAQRIDWGTAKGVDRSDTRQARDAGRDPHGLIDATRNLSLEGL